MFTGSEIKEWVLIGGSAGSLPVIFDLIKSLPKNWPLKTVIVIHRLKSSKNDLAMLFQNKTHVSVKEVEDQELAATGVVYFAPANYHALIEADGRFSLDVSELVWYSRPSIDVLFESFAELYAKKSLAILLSGANADGAKGLAYLKNKGALTIVQSPEDAEVPAMPEAALKLEPGHMQLNMHEIKSFLSNINAHVSD